MVIAALGLFMTIYIRYIEPWERRFFLIMFAVLFMYILSDLVSQISLSLLGSGYWWLSQTAVFCESLFSSLAMPMLMVLLLPEIL